MSKDVKDYVNKCEKCQRNKHTKLPFEKDSNILPMSENENKYIL